MFKKRNKTKRRGRKPEQYKQICILPIDFQKHFVSGPLDTDFIRIFNEHTVCYGILLSDDAVIKHGKKDNTYSILDGGELYALTILEDCIELLAGVVPLHILITKKMENDLKDLSDSMHFKDKSSLVRKMLGNSILHYQATKMQCKNAKLSNKDFIQTRDIVIAKMASKDKEKFITEK